MFGFMIYFDNAATTPLCDAAKEILQQDFGNPSSPHVFGLDAERAVKNAAKSLSGILSCRSDEIVFTSGGTESNNLGILGAAFGLKSARGRNRNLHILASNQEHPSVIEPLNYLASLPGYSVTYAALSEFQSHICKDTAMICITHVSSEIGDILEFERIPGVLMFVDGAQGFCKIQMPSWADIYSFSGHKFHGPMGVGGLMVRKGIRMQPLMYGGGQQKKLRPGTENVPGILAMAAAANESRNADYEKVKKIKKFFFGLGEENRITEMTSPYILNLSFPGIRGEVLTSLLSSHGVMVSMGTACRTAKKESALQTMGFSRDRAESAIRLSFSNMNTIEEARQAKEIIQKCVVELKF